MATKYLTLGVKHDGTHVVLATPDVERLDQRNEVLGRFGELKEHPELREVAMGTFTPMKRRRMDPPGTAARLRKAQAAEEKKIKDAEAKAEEERAAAEKKEAERIAKLVAEEKAKEAAVRKRFQASASPAGKSTE